MAKDDDIDWNGLLLFGSLVGNLVQAGKAGESALALQERDSALQKLLSDREALMQNLREFYRAVESFREKVAHLEGINRSLSRERDSLQETVAELRENINRLEEEKSALATEYAKKLEDLLAQRPDGGTQ